MGRIRPQTMAQASHEAHPTQADLAHPLRNLCFTTQCTYSGLRGRNSPIVSTWAKRSRISLKCDKCFIRDILLKFYPIYIISQYINAMIKLMRCGLHFLLRIGTDVLQ